MVTTNNTRLQLLIVVNSVISHTDRQYSIYVTLDFNMNKVYKCSARSFNFNAVYPRASISQDYWGDIKQDWGPGDPSRVQGLSPTGGLGDFAFFVKLHITLSLIHI